MKKIIQTSLAPAPVGPYNQAIMINDTLYVSGQVAIIPSTGELNLSNIEEETTQVMKNLAAILNEAGLTFENVVKSSIFLTDMEMFGRVNAVYGSFFNADTAPARETVQVANLPKYVNVEISCIAVKF
jgi:2-iminobutanoate/2-iminopropanoate deaminase